MFKKTAMAAALAVGVSGAAAAQDEGLISFKIMNPDVAVELAKAGLESCRAGGYQVAIVVVDRFGNTQAAIRDRFAGPHTVETARRKAWTSVSFRTDTLAMADLAKEGQPQWGVRFVDGALMLGGGVPVEARGSIVAGVGVSGAPTGEADDVCARDGIEAVIDQLEF